MTAIHIATSRWLPAFAALAVSASLMAADPSPAAAKKAAPAKAPVAQKKAPTEDLSNFNIPLWEEGKVPLAKGEGPLDRPFLTVFQPPANKRNGGAIVVAPGGGNIMLMYGVEGLDIAERYNDWGVTAFVLTYRLSPKYGEDARVADAKRAFQVVRFRASQFGLDPKRVGFIGFSAGGNMGRPLALAAGPGDPNAVDPVERQSSKPDYMALVYGAGNPRPGDNLKTFPPTFLIAAAHDRGAANGSAQMFTALNQAGAIVELHLYQLGRHGFGTGYANENFADWMGRLEHFLKVGGFMGGGKL